MSREIQDDIGVVETPAEVLSREQLLALQQHYTLLDDVDDVAEAVSEFPALAGLLLESIEPVRNAFGKKSAHLSVLRSDEDTLLRVSVQLPVDFPDPEAALQSFDNSWWLGNCHRSSGALVFDYEIADGL